jgi:hypothetical protein
MPMIEIRVPQSAIDAAARIGKRMFPGYPKAVDASDVLSEAARRGMESLCKEWNDAEDQVTAKEGK